MKYLKPIVFFLLANLAILLSINIFIYALQLFGINFNTETISGLFILSLFVGFIGAFTSLFLSKWMAKKYYNVQLVGPENKVYRYVEELTKKANLPMPEVGIYYGPANAFATGYSARNSMIAVSNELIENLNDNELKGVLAHEIGHIKNGDMITMTLLQGILNTFVYFFAELLAKIVATNENGEENGLIRFLVSIALQIVFGVFATIIAMWFSRHREYKADEASAYLNGKYGIINALAKLSQIGQPLDKRMKAFGIVGFAFSELFMSHPPIEKRIKHIEELKINQK